jgi:hypothetical protein
MALVMTLVPVLIQIGSTGYSWVVAAQTRAVAPAKSATPTVPISAPAKGIFVTVFPRNQLLPIGRTQQFTAHAFLSTNSAVIWQVNGAPGGNSTMGTITTTGLYTPPASVPVNPKITITAVSQADPTKSDTQNGQIVARVTVSPASDGLHVADSMQFRATVSGVSDPAVKWAVNRIDGGNSTLGTITGDGLYTAPATVPDPNIIGITATSITDPSLPGISSLQIYPPPQLSLFPKTALVLPGNQVIFQYFTNIYFRSIKSSYAHVVTWAVNGTPGGNAKVGTITAAGLYFGLGFLHRHSDANRGQQQRDPAGFPRQDPPLRHRLGFLLHQLGGRETRICRLAIAGDRQGRGLEHS